MADEPLGKPNGNGEERERRKVKEAFGTLLMYLWVHAPLPTLLALPLWFKSFQADGQAAAAATAPTKEVVAAEVGEQLKPIKDQMLALEKELAEMKGYMRAFQLARNGGAGAGAGLGGRFRREEAGAGGPHP